MANSRYLLLPEVAVPHLASHVLALALRRLAGDWMRRYGYAPIFAETAVGGDVLPGGKLGVSGRDRGEGAAGPDACQGGDEKSGMGLPAGVGLAGAAACGAGGGGR